mgnify:FL=1
MARITDFPDDPLNLLWKFLHWDPLFETFFERPIVVQELAEAVLLSCLKFLEFVMLLFLCHAVQQF